MSENSKALLTNLGIDASVLDSENFFMKDALNSEKFDSETSVGSVVFVTSNTTQLKVQLQFG